ncbi:MAG: UDP-N-acetylglucosamine 4,6-dehydratase (inverting), partial [Burkholderiales bacterium]|nr:UDP-N-acetylglucosamine 4,6-dehydratase (inverting) [Burkholderiales bacterium]
MVDGSSLLITGGTGSFGRAFVKHLLTQTRVRRLVVFSRDELKQSEMAQELAALDGGRLRFFLGDVRDHDRLEMALSGVDFVVHAAALKQVPAAEYNPMECIRTNVIGAENVTRASIRCGVKRVVALSTDKAVNPANLYGASKLAADKVFIAAHHLVGARDTRFAVVRYGNVIGSRGSLVPLVQKLLRDNAESIPITDFRMTRFWITLSEGVGFTLSSLEMMCGGEIFTPIIPSMKVTDVVSCLAPSIPQREIGIRPGEKLHETLISSDDARCCIRLKDRFVVVPPWHLDRVQQLWPEASPVPADFAYTSDSNDWWLSPANF